MSASSHANHTDTRRLICARPPPHTFGPPRTCRADQPIVKEHMAEKLEAIIEDEEVDAIANKDAKARSTSTSNDAELEDELSSRFNETEKVMSSSSTDEHVEKPIQDPAVEAFTSDPSLVDGARFATKPESNSTPTTPSSSSTEDV